MKQNTFVNHPPEVEVPSDNRPLVAPIYQSVKFSFDDAGETLRYLRGEREGFYYSRTSNPTLRQLELLLAQLQGREEVPGRRARGNFSRPCRRCRQRRTMSSSALRFRPRPAKAAR